MGTFVSISGGGNANVQIYGNGSVAAGNGNDTISISGTGAITVGAGHDLLSLGGSGYIIQSNSGQMVGNDTINFGSGNDTLTEAGNATVHGAFGSATVDGGKFQFLEVKTGGNSGGDHDDDGRGGNQDHGSFGSHDYGSYGSHDQGRGGDYGKSNDPNCHDGGTSQQIVYQELAIDGKATLVGGSNATQFIAGSGSVVMQGGSGNDTFMGGSGQSMMTGGTGHNLFEVAGFSGIGGTDVITNFVSGNDQLYLEGQSLAYLQSQHDISTSGGNTLIKLDGGQTTVELKGFTSLASSDITTHKG